MQDGMLSSVQQQARHLQRVQLPDSNNIINNNNNHTRVESSSSGWIRPHQVYGLLHMAKTGGTEINGQLANHFERVCGNKGYSYDALQTNSRFYNKKLQQQLQVEANDPPKQGKRKRQKQMLLYEMDMGDVISQVKARHNRGNIPRNIMVEIGFDDCDYVALETVRPSEWTEYVAQQWPLELHVPCRDALDHLMSSCNHQGKTFNCDASDDANLAQQVRTCVNPRLTNTRFKPWLAEHPNITLQCFQPFPVSSYVNYMGRILQRKRVESTYVHRESNPPRNRTNECIWTATETFQDAVRQQLKKQFPCYRFCEECMGSVNELRLDG